MIRKRGRGFISGKMDECMMENGKTVNNTEKVPTYYPTANQRKADGKMDKELNG